jgi:predicted enzyme related to lactoylglutathione lyase
MKVRRIVPDIRSTDIPASIEFYTEILGLEVGMDLGWIASLTSPSNETAQISFMTHDATAPVTPDVSIEVSDVDEAYRRAVERGAEIVHELRDEPWGVRRFFVRDPNGQVLNVLTHLPR